MTRTYAPCGQPPVRRAALTRDQLAVIGAVTATGRCFTHSQAQSCTGAPAVAFLRHLLRPIAGNLVVVWDGASIHHGQARRAFLTAGAAARRRLERRPAYARTSIPPQRSGAC